MNRVITSLTIVNNILFIVTMGHARLELGLVASVTPLQVVWSTLINNLTMSSVTQMDCHHVTYVDRIQIYKTIHRKNIQRTQIKKGYT
jgi:hypothetical protein